MFAEGKMNMQGLIIRPAKIFDIAAILLIINEHANRGLMLEKTYCELLELLPNFFVAEISGKIIGVCGFKIWLTEEAEIISSAVIEEYHRKGIGTKLNRRCIGRARTLGLTRFFTLTKQPEFYISLGFVEISKQEISYKLYVDCLKCKDNKNRDPNFILSANCQDVAMRLLVP
jgi:amino-acid N-acetyltransferase